jgi:hypothetical protein
MRTFSVPPARRIAHCWNRGMEALSTSVALRSVASGIVPALGWMRDRSSAAAFSAGQNSVDG